MTPAKVLYIVDALGLSGKTKSLVDLACGLDPARYTATVCCFGKDQSPLRSTLNQHDIPVVETPCRDGINLQVVRGLVRVMREVRPDVVHCYNPRAMLYGSAATRLAGIRGTIGSLSAFACLVPTNEFDFLPQPLMTRTWRNRMRNRAATYLVRYLVTVSRTLGERFCRYNGMPLHKLRVVPYGISLDAAWSFSDQDVACRRHRIGTESGDVLIGSVGRLVEQKDFPTQLRAFALARRHVPHLRMVLAGEGPLRQSLEELAHSLGVGDRVHFLGHCDHVPLVLRCLDVFVLTSQFEPYGVALIEAKAAGLAIAATNVNEIPEIVTDEKSGLLCPARNPQALADVFVRLAQNPDLRRRLGEQSLAEAKGRHDLRATIGKYQDLYDDARDN